MINERGSAISSVSISQVGALNPTKDSTGFVKDVDKISKMPRKRAYAAEHPLIGTMTDRSFSKLIGVAESTVGLARRDLNMPRYIPPPLRGEIMGEDEVMAQPDLGIVADRVISTRLNVPPSRVQRVRSKNGIESMLCRNHSADHRYKEPPNEVAQLMRGWGR